MLTIRSMNHQGACPSSQNKTDQSNIDAINNYDLTDCKIEGVSIDQEACCSDKMAADNGDIDAMYNYGLMPYQGEGVSMNKEEACRYF